MIGIVPINIEVDNLLNKKESKKELVYL